MTKKPQIKIDKNVPIPPEDNRTPRYPFLELEVGDSFLTSADDKYPTIRAGGANRQYHPMRFRSKREGDRRRIWRVA